MIQSLLVANRGEIACRVIRTAQRLGIRTVAVYSEVDAQALHVRAADHAIRIGPAPARESYLVGERIIAAARQAGAEAIHPGYGFLSENADFATAVQGAGLVWVGPNPDSIRAMGLKDAAKARMIAAGVPVTPGYLGKTSRPNGSVPRPIRSAIPCSSRRSQVAAARACDASMCQTLSPTRYNPAGGRLPPPSATSVCLSRSTS
jgi:acetyl/propionyl-CoA carboxylase alpha subunit